MTKEETYHIAYEAALSQLRNASTPSGILASTIEQDNYNRIWSRDAVIAGLAGIFAKDAVIAEGLKQSLLTLAAHQLPKGTIPSNVELSTSHNKNVSYGTLAGRVDATSWFVIGSCLYIQFSNDHNFKDRMENHLQKALQIMDCWEFNDRSLIYTPLSGNWADEYPLHGYLLYDNILRYWGLSLYQKVYGESELLKHKLETIKTVLEINFWPKNEIELDTVYHSKIFKIQASDPKPYFLAGFNPAGYYPIFDASANGLMMLLELTTEEQLQHIDSYLDTLASELNNHLIPAFWPVIEEGDALWSSLIHNYAYDFKNIPHHFHNGGIWPVMMGLFVMGLSQNILKYRCHLIFDDYLSCAFDREMNFSEYIDSEKFKLRGKTAMSFSASGTIFMYLSAKNKINMNFH